MAALVAGREYGLSSNDSTSANKTVLHVKLTDSALKAIEEYQKFKNKISSKANIEFTGSQGTICIPSYGEDNSVRRFQFNVTNSQAENKGSFECIRQDFSSSSLDFQGEIKHKVTVLANDDVYQSTRQKVAIAESQSKKNCAKEIKCSSIRGGTVKKIINRTPSANQYSRNSGTSYPGSSYHQPTISPNARLPSSASLPVLHNQASSQAIAKPRSVINTMQSEIDPTARSKSRSPVAGSTTRPKINISYRDRIIHYLALHPYKRLELVLRLQNDGVRDKDKLMTTLKQVAVHNVRLNQYSLHKHLYSEVQPNCPIYNDNDRLMLKQRLQELTGPSPNHPSNSPIVSPVHSNSSQVSSPDTINLKRHKETQLKENYQSNSAKRQRLAHVRKPPTTMSQMVHIPPPRPVIQPTAAAPTPAAAIVKPPPTMEAISEEAAIAEQPDYTSKYVKVISKEQRMQYKGDFDKEYKDYLQLRLTIESFSNLFTELRDELRKHNEGTKEYETVRDQIFKQYAIVKAEPKYSERRKRCDDLHKKLGLIKSLIHDFDILRC